MSNDRRGQSGQNGTGPSGFSMYASRFLNGTMPRDTAIEASQVSCRPSLLSIATIGYEHPGHITFQANCDGVPFSLAGDH